MRSNGPAWILAAILGLGVGSMATAQDEASPKRTKKGKPAKTAAKKKSKDAKGEGAPEETEPANPSSQAGPGVMALAQSTRIGLEYHLGMVRTDNGLEATADIEPDAGLSTSLQAMKLNLSGEFNSQAEFEVKLDFTAPTEVVEIMRGIWLPTKTFGVSAGKSYVAEGGFEMKNDDYKSLALSPYNAGSAPLPSSSPMLEILLKIAGQISLQITEDQLVGPRVDGTTATASEATQQPAIFVEWAGDFKAAKPLVQVGSYDKGRSKYLGVGFGLELKTLNVYLDLVNDLRSHKYQKTLDPTDQTRFDSTHRLVALEGSLELMRASELFFKFSTYQVLDPDEPDFGIEEKDYNGDGLPAEALDDDALTILLGYRHGLVEKFFRPYFAIARVSGRFLDPEDPETPVDRAELRAHLGVFGEM